MGLEEQRDVAAQELDGGNVNTVVRVGDTVRRTAGPWTPAVHALLAWVRERGVTCVPAPLGLDDDGREILSWMPGEVVGWPVPDWLWTAQTRAQAGAMLRTVHDATVGFDLSDRVWRSPTHHPVEVVCLNDVAPYNMVFDGTDLIGLIDVDMASPGPRAWDLAYLAYRLCGWCEDMRAPDDATPLDRLAHLLSSYGQDAAPPIGDVLTTMVTRLHDLADWTDEHARAADRPDLHDHAAMYRRDAARLLEQQASRDG
ncbi:phosphotransferase [Cellulomonas sp. zg-ZUI222]|uniref:phosphotransferase n=1 Tax=Cellulomonas TaxID=1707 RepID=UPI001A945462|nr:MULTISPECIES: phosphotransferase [Cellulomonas]MBO0898677.1 phosphotransferase [Cellulomonas sp. zg-ZUI22]MBO0919540.1 phosphotransferase [Cellulomonas wangleii]